MSRIVAFIVILSVCWSVAAEGPFARSPDLAPTTLSVGGDPPRSASTTVTQSWPAYDAPNGTDFQANPYARMLAEPVPPSPAPAAPVPRPQPMWAASPTLAAQLPVSSSTWYTRADYFHWNERVDGADFVNEDGVLWTLGYARRYGSERVRVEWFGGRVGYNGAAQFDDGTTEPLRSHTGYFGLRAELELLAEPDWSPAATWFAGFGNRFWFRDLPDDVTASGTPVLGYQETWWTLYPYVGVERRRIATDDLEFYGSCRIGMIAFTYEHVTANDSVLYPKLGVTGQTEAGIRGPHLLISSFFEGMTWGRSNISRGALQPGSTLLLVGLKSGFTF